MGQSDYKETMKNGNLSLLSKNLYIKTIFYFDFKI